MSETSIVLASTGKISREELAMLPTPPATATHRTVPHHVIVEALVETLGSRQIGVIREEYAASSGGMRMFGVLDLATGFEGCASRLGFATVTIRSLDRRRLRLNRGRLLPRGCFLRLDCDGLGRALHRDRVMRAIWRRVAALEKRRSKDIGSPKVTIRFAHLHSLPHTYTAERHELLIREFPSSEPGGDCLIQEYPGPGPGLDFGFAPGTILLQFVGSDGDGHLRGY